MSQYLSNQHFPSASPEADFKLKTDLSSLLDREGARDFFAVMGGYQRILANPHQRKHWPEIQNRLMTLFQCGKPVALDGPMIGIPVSIRDTDDFKDAVALFGKERSLIAGIEWMATVWNATFADTGIWMGKTYEPISREAVAEICENDPDIIAAYDVKTSRIGRNFFREPHEANALQALGLPVLEAAWRLRNRPTSTSDAGFAGALLDENLEKEKAIPYRKTGGIFLANLGHSVVPEMHGKRVYQLNYRWNNLNPPFPMTRLIDEVVQIADGLYLGQLVFASRHYNLGSIDLPFMPGEQDLILGERYAPRKKASWWDRFLQWLTRRSRTKYVDYGYQHNGFFLMMDPAYAKQIYDDDAFPQLRPRKGESGHIVLGYQAEAEAASAAIAAKNTEWLKGRQKQGPLKEKFTQFIVDPSTGLSVREVMQSMRHEGESILQMLQRISTEISAQSKLEDHLRHFEKLHLLFRSGLAPTIQNGLFQGHGKAGYNIRAESTLTNRWYGENEVTTGFDYYHGATLNLHLGFNESVRAHFKEAVSDATLFPSAMASLLNHPGPNMMNMVWQSIGRYIFPWAGKSFEKISARKLSMLLDESDDLEIRYPERVAELKSHLASLPHYDLVKKNKDRYWPKPGPYGARLRSGSWDHGMSDEDKAFWRTQAAAHWVMGKNLQDKRVLSMDAMMRIADMNYQEPDPSLLRIAEEGPSPFARQGYVFLGAAEQDSILPMNAVNGQRKKVFQFHYRYPMIGGLVPIGYCLDELVEIADGLYLGQLIYATALDRPFHSSVDPTDYKYQLFGYFLLMDDDWQRHRLAIGLDLWQDKKDESGMKKILGFFN